MQPYSQFPNPTLHALSHLCPFLADVFSWQIVQCHCGAVQLDVWDELLPLKVSIGRASPSNEVFRYRSFSVELSDEQPVHVRMAEGILQDVFA
eukprot:2542266-Amphidinium_carterae.1